MGVSISISILQNSQSTENNTSNVTVSVELSWDGGWYNNNKKHGELYIDGVAYGFFANFNWNGTYSSGSTTLFSQTVNVPHSSDGTKTLSCSAYYESGVSIGTVHASAEKTLTTIPRASSISLASSIYFGDACEITWSPLSSSFYYKLRFSMGEWNYTTGAINPGTTSSYTYTGYKIPLTVASQIPNTTSGTMYVTLYTYNSSSCNTQIGSTSTTSFEVALSDSVIPTISACKASISNVNSVVARWGIALSGYSKVNISATASGAYGSTIISFSISGAYTETVSGSSLNYTGDIITSSGDKVFVVKCTDSRGRVSQEYTTNTIQFLPYALPKVKQLSMSKDTKNDDNAANDRVVAVSTWEIDPVNGRNYATAKLYYKVSSAANWIAHSGTLSNGMEFELTDLVPDELLSYNFRIVVEDALGNSAEKDAFLSTVTVLLDFKAGGNGLGIGKICEQEAMEVAMKAIFYNDMYIGNKDTTLDNYIDARIHTRLAKSSEVDAVNKLLWTNSSPTSTFASQTISVSLDSYTHIGVIFKQAYSVNYYFPMAIYQKGLPGTYAAHSNGILTKRNITSISASGVTFGNGLYYDDDLGSEKTSNGFIIPYKIYGIKEFCDEICT